MNYKTNIRTNIQSCNYHNIVEKTCLEKHLKINNTFRRYSTNIKIRNIPSLNKSSIKHIQIRLRKDYSISTKSKYTGDLNTATVTSNDRFGIVVSKFNSLVTKSLLEGCLEAFKKFNITEEQLDIAWVTGSFEIPLIAKSMANSGKYNAIVAIGAVIEGSTSHYDAVVNAATSGIVRAALDTGVPVIFGVLTCDNLEQALDRAGGKFGNKGYDAGISALEMSSLLTKLKSDNKAVLKTN